MPTDYKAKGLKNVTAWVRPELHAALRQKLWQDKMTLQSLFTKFLEAYTGVKVEINDATGKPDPPGEV